MEEHLAGLYGSLARSKYTHKHSYIRIHTHECHIYCMFVKYPMTYLVIVHGDTELVLKLEGLSPDDSSEPEAVVGVD